MVYYTRAQWGAAPPSKPPIPWSAGMPNSLTVHAVGANVGMQPDYLGTVKSIQTHAFGKGLSDIDYNYLVDYHGNIYEGRIPGNQSGAQGNPGNATSLAVCYLDNGDGDVPFTVEAQQAILTLRAQHVVGGNVAPIHPHRWWNAANIANGHPEWVTSCPGDEIANWCAAPGVIVTLPSGGTVVLSQQDIDTIVGAVDTKLNRVIGTLQTNLRDAIGVIVDGVAAKVSAGVTATATVDTAAISKAVADELAKRLVS